MNPKAVKHIADLTRWRFDHKWKNQPNLEFKQMDKRVLVNYEHNRVTTILYHPKFKARFGATRLIRENVDEKLLAVIFNYPRVHTDRGRYLKS
jgi:hypothetical protein